MFDLLIPKARAAGKLHQPRWEKSKPSNPVSKDCPQIDASLTAAPSIDRSHRPNREQNTERELDAKTSIAPSRHRATTGSYSRQAIQQSSRKPRNPKCSGTVRFRT